MTLGGLKRFETGLKHMTILDMPNDPLKRTVLALKRFETGV